jgi:hypothetical protein
MTVTRTSPFSGKVNTREIPVTQEQLGAWFERKGLIQDIMPNISADDREFIKTGITPEEWDEAFGEEDQ